MAILNVATSQIVRIPDLTFEGGEIFFGRVESSDGQTLRISYDDDVKIDAPPDCTERTYTMAWRVGGKARACPILIRSYGQGELVGQVVIDEKRQCLRVRCRFTMWFARLEPDEIQAASHSIMSRLLTIAEPENKLEDLRRHADDEEDSMRGELVQIRRLLEKLTSQMGYLTTVIEHRDADHQDDVDERLRKVDEIYDCSETGMAFRSPEYVPVGTHIKMRLHIDGEIKITIECIGVVVRSEPRTSERLKPDQFDLGVRFTHIHEADRERIVRHLFKIQRTHLRDRRAAG